MVLMAEHIKPMSMAGQIQPRTPVFLFFPLPWIGWVVWEPKSCTNTIKGYMYLFHPRSRGDHFGFKQAFHILCRARRLCYLDHVSQGSLKSAQFLGLTCPWQDVSERPWQGFDGHPTHAWCSWQSTSNQCPWQDRFSHVHQFFFSFHAPQPRKRDARWRRSTKIPTL